MNVVALARVKNEADVIEEFVRHTLQFVDALFVVDNASFDDTGSILRALAEEGLALTLLHDDVLAYRQSPLMTGYVRQIFAETSADFIVLLDADEFLKPSSIRLNDALASLPPGAHGLIPWETYVPTPDAEPGEPRTLIRITKRLKTESQQYFKIVVSRSFADHAGASIAQGNHDIAGPEGFPETLRLEGLSLAHFPVRSIAQIQSKALIGWTAYLAMGTDETSGLGYQWHRIYEQLWRNPHWDAHDLFRCAVHYLGGDTEALPELEDDPLPATERKHARASRELLSVAIDYTRQLAGEYARLWKEHERLRSAVSSTTDPTAPD